jgi:hypothetical protein
VNRTKVLILNVFLIIVTVAPLKAYAQYGSGEQSVYCASDDMRRHYCNVGRNNGVRLERQRSDARCIEGSTWGSSRDQIWVDRGCRADFTVFPERGGWNGGGRPGEGSGGVVSCSSDNMRRNFCDIGPNRGVRLVRQRSDARCVEGQTYGVNRDQMWVDRGCRGDFEVLASGHHGGGWGGNGNGGWGGDVTSTVVYCASDDMRRNYCNVGSNRGIKLTRQRSDAKCELNRSYGFSRDQIWVDRGCRADFEVMQRR